MSFKFGKDAGNSSTLENSLICIATELTLDQVLEQCKMYIAAGRIAHDFGCDVIGIQYQQGLKDMCPASDLAEGILNNVDRPPIHHKDTKEELFPGKPIVHFNEGIYAIFLYSHNSS